MSWFKKSPPAFTQKDVDALIDKALLMANASNDAETFRNRLASTISGGYDNADTLHNIYLDFGYPDQLNFSHFWNMYRRFGIATAVVELTPDTMWISPPTIEGSDQFNRDFEIVVQKQKFWQRLKGLDTRQRVGRYAGMFMRVRDGLKPSEPIGAILPGVGSLIQMIPLYESQLRVLETNEDALSDDFDMPTMYQFDGSVEGNRDEKNSSSFSIHPDRIVIAAEGADNGSIYGIPALEAPYNSLMDIRKVCGGGGEGFYKNAAKDVIFSLGDASQFKGNEKALAEFGDQFDDFQRNRHRRALVSPGLDAMALESNLVNPKDFFFNSLYDVAAASMIPATILIGQQTGRLASSEDSKHFLSMTQSRRENYGVELVQNNIDWLIKWGILPASEYEVEWDDLLAMSDDEKLTNANSMAEINNKQFLSGGTSPFAGEEIREVAGFEPEEMPEPSEELTDEDDGNGQTE